jgi:hypothetical protein
MPWEEAPGARYVTMSRPAGARSGAGYFPRQFVASHGKFTVGSDNSPAYLGNLS